MYFLTFAKKLPGVSRAQLAVLKSFYGAVSGGFLETYPSLTMSASSRGPRAAMPVLRSELTLLLSSDCSVRSCDHG